MHDASADDREHGDELLDAFHRNAEVVLAQHGEIRELTGSDAALHVLLLAEPRTADGEQPHRLVARQTVVVGEQWGSTHGPARDEPVERRPGVVAADASAVRSRAHW